MKINERVKTIVVLISMVIVAYFFWDTPIIYPIKLFVVILHELSHGIAAIVCGGHVQEIKINYQIGGSCTFTMPPGFLRNVFVASAGYIGSMLWGALIVISSARTRYDKFISLTIGLVVFIIAVFFVRELFGFIFCVVFSILMFAISYFLPEWFNDYILKFLGMSSCFYAIVDIKGDLIDRSGIGSDADVIAGLLGISQFSIIIGIIWIIIASIIMGYALKIASYGEGKTTCEHSSQRFKLE